jgi:hypothetical protein
MTVTCAGCGLVLLREQHAGLPTPWFATEGVASVVAARNGWDAAGHCPTCQTDTDD